MTTPKTKQPSTDQKFVVRCDAFTSAPMTMAQAVAWKEQVEKLGACKAEHHIVLA